ncbi:secretion protein EspA [Caballeronia sp. EK]|uniref:secretion protein EspA n=1 Tax=Caballeronia sp. EK TaxID=2767469 RepID=UPI0016550054|nr:secretion protein EspA [Caballeronia sp. EK]MBC8642924.1 secretion protein EspA [Caballeronia sp. EK]
MAVQINEVNAANLVGGAAQPTYGGGSITSDGIAVLYKFMNLYTDQAQQKYEQMSYKADRSRNSQQVANQVDAIIAQLSKPDEKGNIPMSVLEYLKQNKIMITANEDIESYIKSHGDWTGLKLSKGDLEVVKGALESDSGRCSDFVSQAQLQIQKYLQSYNVCVSMINSMQSMVAEASKRVAESIR